jgi:hypothetical protein
MVAFSARSWKAVDDFYAAALANGGFCDWTSLLEFTCYPVEQLPGEPCQFGKDQQRSMNGIERYWIDA